MKTFDQIKKDYLIKLLAHVHGNMTNAARVSGISRMTLYRLMEQYNLYHNDYKIKEPE